MEVNISESTHASAMTEEPVTYWYTPYRDTSAADTTAATLHRTTHSLSRRSHTASKYAAKKQTNSSAGFRDAEENDTVPPQNSTTAKAATITSSGSQRMIRFPRNTFREKQRNT